MPALPIRMIGDPVLRQSSRELSRDELLSEETQSFIDDLIDTMRAANGAGIAAPQVGRLLSIAVVHVQDNPRYPYKPNIPLTVFVNPRITFLSSETESLFEGCLSVPNLRGRVDRCMHIRVDAWDREGNPMSFEVKGLTAGTYQHEFDHLQGQLFVDRVTDACTFSTWDNFHEFYRDEFVAEAEALVQKYGS